MKIDVWKDFPLRPLPKLLSFIVDNRGKSVPTSTDGKNILIATNCIRNENLYPTYENIRYFSDEVYQNWFRAHPLPGDIIFVNKGTPGRTCIVPNPADFSIAQDMMAFRTDKNILNNRYLLCILRSHKIQEQIRLFSVGDTIPHFKKQFLNQILIPVPSLQVQEYIADWYFSFSEKIELNNAINKNLEEQAQAIFKSWFVDFEPWGGTMPDAWRLYKLSEFLPVITGKKNANVASDKGKYPFFSCAQDIAWTDQVSFEGSAILVAGNGDFNVKFYTGKFEAYQRTYVLIPNNPAYTAWLYYAIKHSLNDITIAARGSVIKFITKGNLENFTFPAPSNLSGASFIGTFNSINDIIAKNREENRKLAALRDTLLPRLMSGEIDVSGIEI